MPNGPYAQGAQANKASPVNPITTALQNSSGPSGNQAPAPTNTSVTRDGRPNLAFTPPPTITGRYSNGDSDVNDASTIVGNAYQQYLGRPAGFQDIHTQLANQGLKTGDRFVGQSGLNSVLQGIYSSPEANAYRAKPVQHAPGPDGSGSALDFIHQWQGSHSPGEGISPLLSALQGQGFQNVSPYMYGSTQSHNEITLDGQKFKVLGGEDSPGAYWYQGGDDSAPGQSPQTNPFQTSLMSALAGGQSMTPSYSQQLLQQIMQQLALTQSLT